MTFSCFNRRRLLVPDICKRALIGTLALQLRKQKGICIGFVIMPEHVHAMLWFPDENQISACMDKWKEKTSKEIASFYQRRMTEYYSALDPENPVWQPKYYGFNVYSQMKLREKLNYMHNNPVRAGLVKDICDWPWSSARFWHMGKPVGIPLSWPP